MPHYDPAPDRYRSMHLPPLRPERAHAAGALARALAQLRRRPARSTTQRAILRRAFDLGITHFDLANNYGPPYGSAEAQLRPRSSARDFARPTATSCVISTKAGWDMWPGPYGDLGSRKYLLASLDQSLRRLGRRLRRHLLPPPLRSRHSARRDASVRSTPPCARARPSTSGISSYSDERTQRGDRDPAPARDAAAHPPAVVLDVQPLDRGPACSTSSATRASGASRFSPLAQGLLTDRYLHGIPAGSRRRGAAIAAPATCSARRTSPACGRSNDIATRRGQTLAQMALAWALRDPRVTSLAHRGEQRRPSSRRTSAALDNLSFTEQELKEIDVHAVEGGIDLWRGPATS